MFATPGTPYLPTPKQHDAGGRRPRARGGFRGKNLSKFGSFCMCFFTKEMDDLMIFSWSSESCVWFSLSQMTGASIVFLKKVACQTKMGSLLVWHSCQLVSVFLLGRGMNHPMNPVTYHLLLSSNVAGYSPRWSAIELGGDIPNQLGSLELANLPRSLHDSPDTTGKQMIKPMETSLYCFCFNCNSNAIIFVLISDTCWS